MAMSRLVLMVERECSVNNGWISLEEDDTFSPQEMVRQELDRHIHGVPMKMIPKDWDAAKAKALAVEKGAVVNITGREVYGIPPASVGYHVMTEAIASANVIIATDAKGKFWMKTK